MSQAFFALILDYQRKYAQCPLRRNRIEDTAGRYKEQMCRFLDALDIVPIS
jgi:hypothetical protein